MCNRLFSLKDSFVSIDLKTSEVMKGKKIIFIKTEVNKVFWDDTSEDISSKKNLVQVTEMMRIHIHGNAIICYNVSKSWLFYPNIKF